MYSLFSRTYSSVRSQPNASPVPSPSPEVEPDQQLRGVHRGACGGPVEVDRAAVPRRRRRAGRRSRSGADPGRRAPGCRRAGRRRRRSPAASRTAASASRALPAARDPAPVRVAAVDRGLDERRADDGPGHRSRVGVVGGARDLAGDQRGGALAVGRLLAGELAGHGLDREAQLARLARALADRRRAGGARGEQEHRVVGGRVAVDAQLVPRPGRRRAEQGVEERGLRGASVRTTASIVAIRGWIIPTPLAMPVTRIGRTARPSGSGSVIVTVAALVRVSVVRSASAASASAASVAASAGRARRSRTRPGRAAAACR